MNTFDKLKADFASADKLVKIKDIDRERAAKLRSFVRTKGWRVSVQKARWAKALGILRRRLDDDSLIDRVLDYIIKVNLDEPKITDGAKLAKDAIWDWLVRLMTDDVEAVDISPEAKRIAERLKDKGWPTHVKEKLPLIVQKSLDNLRPFYIEVYKRAIEYNKPIPVKYDPKKHPKWAKGKILYKDDQRKYRYNEMGHAIWTAEAFINRYFNWLNEQAWEGFSWKLPSIIFKVDSGMGLQFGLLHGRWEQIMKEIKHGE